MTRDQQQLAIWCGAAVAVLITVSVVFSMQAQGLAEAKSKADKLYADYRNLYPTQGTPANEALESLQRLRDHQAKARQEAEARLVATLPTEYQRSNMTDAGSKLNSDVTALKQRAERQKIPLPAMLPYESSFDPNQDKCSLQLANLFLYKQVLDICLDVGVTKVNAVEEGRSYRDVSGLYATVTCKFTVEGKYEAIIDLLDNLRTKHENGIGIRELHLNQGQQDCNATLVASLLTINNPAWQLAVEAGADRRATFVGGPPIAAPPKRSRLGGN